jgi:hypothetical protein
MARAWVEAKSTIRVLSALSAGSCRGYSCSGPAVVACSLTRWARRCAAFYSALGYRAWACAYCHPPAPPDEHTVARRGGRCPAAVLPSAGGDRRRSLSCQSVLHQWCGCDGGTQSPRAVPPWGWESSVPLPS